ncbi:Quinohemoprotein alcohol dehydrogenase ADH IIB [Geodia barretti]|uniref:Quinohemoprotein alcohol dehydrogenase ADH IIB n=1 Tax=Geodia barretti TaxID=519541 RepID=A0AA35SAX6_GEOBA|nr:Quinohemoprotein alcohol dehydrogenase ADH IIB [Geodia barretti]
MWRMKMVLVAGALAAVLVGCGREPELTRADAIRAATATVSTDRIRSADAEPGNWLAHGRTYDEQRHSPLTRINDENVDGLGLACGTWSRVYANDGRTGELIWQYDPKVPKEWGKYACCDVVNRGVAVWKGRVFVGTLDGRLVALDAGTGEVVWEVLTIDPERPYTITGAPRVVKGLVVIGNGGAEYGVRGYITAYDWETGEQKWRFWTVPGDPSKPFESKAMEMAVPTWNGEWWIVGGGGTVWDSMAFDPELNLLYIGVGNGTPWNRDIRSPGGGDNLYLSSIVAINPDDGTMAWHYQTTPGETWDYTATQHMILADIEIDGALRKVIMQAPKNGFFYVLDRTDGTFISAQAYVPVNWASHIDPASGRPVESPGARYEDAIQLIFPSVHGGHNWHPMAYNPDTGYVYIPALDMAFPYGQDADFEYRPGAFNTGIDIVPLLPPKTVDGQVQVLQSMKGHLAAWDPVAQKEGRSDGYFAAYAADSGALLWETPVYMGIIAAPVAYTIDGEQYIAVVAGWGGSFTVFSGVPRHKGNVLTEGRILAFKLGGTAELPRPAVTHVNIPEPPAIDATPEVVARGELLYHTWCSGCHGSGVTSGSSLPDLKYLSADAHASWDLIVREGVYASVGMPGFDHVLSEADSQAVQAYVVNQTRGAIAFCESEYPDVYPELFGTACTKRVVAQESSAAEVTPSGR